VLRRALRQVLRLALRIFFRRVQVRGEEHVPASGPVIFVVNHPNGLVDPVFLLCFAPRPAAFLAKEPLFRMPVVGFFVRALDSIPVHRRQDPGADLAKNAETFAAARALLARGGAIAIFPEGASHADPKMRPARTGAARIALAAAARIPSAPAPASVRIVPAGLYYTARARFRSGALLSFGIPFEVPALQLRAAGEEPPRDAVRSVTERVEQGLDALTLQADSREALELVSRAERIFASEEGAASLADELERRRRFVEGAAILRGRDPQLFERLATRIGRFDAERREAGLSLRDLAPGGLSTAAVFALLAKNAAALLAAPFALAGALLHYPAYRLAGILATRWAGQSEDVVSTFKIGVSLLLFPATWIAAAAVAGRALGWKMAVGALLLAPISGYAALAARESLDAVIGRARALADVVLGGSATRRLLARRRAIREELERLAAELGLA
jgi:glycerol-3-phosphate O-acyltransferase/dihydroxyacetone phosphate acyltransferase